MQLVQVTVIHGRKRFYYASLADALPLVRRCVVDFRVRKIVRVTCEEAARLVLFPELILK